MDKQIKYLLGALVLLLIAAYFISLLSGLPQYFKDDIIAFLEESLAGEISFSSISLWPLNRLQLQSFSFEDEKGNKFKVDRLNLDYQLNLDNFDKIIEIKFIEAKQAEIVIKEEFSAAETENEDLTAAELENFKISNIELPKFMEGININILDSELFIQNSDYDLEFDNLNFGLNAQNSRNYQLNISTAFLINSLSYNDLNFSELEGENIDLQLQRQDQEAEFYFKTGSLAAEPFIKLLSEKDYSFQGLNIDLNKVESQFKAAGKVEFKKAEVSDYRAEINFSNLNFSSIYQTDTAQKNFDFVFNDLNLVFSGPEFNLFIPENRFLLDNKQLQFSLKLDQELNYQLKLAAEEFNYDYQILSPELESGEFSFDLNLNGKKGKVTQARALVDGKNIVNKYTKVSDSHFEIKFLNNELFLEKAELELADSSKLDLQASYNLSDQNYLLSAEAESLKISKDLISTLEEYNLAADYLEQLKKIENDRLDFTVDTAGYYSRSRGISAAGDFDFSFNFQDQDNQFKLSSEFWFVDQKLFLNSFKLFSDFAYFDLLGEIDFAKKELNLRYAARNFEPAILNQSFNLNFDFLNTINPTIEYFEGKIADSFSNPTISMDLQLDQLAYQNYAFSDIKIKAIYENDDLKLTEAKTSFAEAELSLTGEIRELTADAVMDLNLRSENLYFQDLAKSFDSELPLRGRVELKAELNGAFKDYDLDFNLNTSNTLFSYQGQEFELSNLSSNIKKENDNFKITDFSFEQQNLSFKASGIYNLDSGFDLNYQLTGIELQNYLNDYPQIAEKTSGSLSLNGDLKGELENLILRFKLAAENTAYDGLDFKIKENQFEFKFAEERLELKNFEFAFASGHYLLEGEIFDLSSRPSSNFNLKMLEVPTAEFLEKYLEFYPFAQEIILKGESQIQTEGSNYQAFLDIDGYLGESEESSFKLNGEIGRDLDLNFEASDLPLAFTSTQYNFNLDTKANLNCSGSLSGQISTPILNLSHNFDSIEINNTALQSISGDILIEHQRRFSASETISFLQGGSLDIDGSYSFVDDDLSLSSNLQSLPLSFILSFFEEQIAGDGQLNGSFRAQGSLGSPSLNGNLKLAGNSLEVGIWAPIENYRGEIELQDGQALIKELEGEFVDGSFQLGGKLNLLDRDDFWDLSLDAKKLYFDYGSLRGNFDSQVKFSGPLSDPLLAGKMDLYDFIVAIPFEWPAGGGESNEDAFIPRIDLELIPKNNLRVKNQNMDILVEDGDLSLDFNHQRDNSLMMEGRLRSNEGRFSYYNSRFTLNSAEAIFTPVDEGDIPNLQVNATTYAGGREININLLGPANNMRITFTSTPEMTEEEILNLLSSRGALGSAIIGGEDIGVQQIILQELIRIVNGFLQEDIISDIESDFRTALSLDRIEIDALQYGLEREFAVYLGKNLSDRFYLEYAAFFREDEEREDEISFQYKLTEITNLKGSYFGDDEYQITLENEIEF